MGTSGESKLLKEKNKPTDLFDDYLIIARRPGQDEGYGLLESDYETIRLFSIGTIIKSLSSENLTKTAF